MTHAITWFDDVNVGVCVCSLLYKASHIRVINGILLVDCVLIILIHLPSFTCFVWKSSLFIFLSLLVSFNLICLWILLSVLFLTSILFLFSTIFVIMHRVYMSRYCIIYMGCRLLYKVYCLAALDVRPSDLFDYKSKTSSKWRRMIQYKYQ